MTSISDASLLFKKTFWTLADQEIFTADNNPDVIPLVAFGHPGTSRPDDIVVFQGLRQSQEPGALSTQHSRELTMELDILISVFRGGAEAAEEQASEAAYGYLNQLEEYVRVTDTTVGGTVRYCFLDKHESEGWTVGPTDAGRNITIIATFGAHLRLR